MHALRSLKTLVRIAVAAVLAGLVPSAGSETITVCWDGSGDYLTIQEGIDAAIDGDEVVVCDGTYTGPGNKNLDFAGKAITVRSASGDAALCIIDCEDNGYGFYFHAAETPCSVVAGLTVRNASNSAIRCDESSPTITNCALTGNRGGSGGAVACYNSGARITDCAIVSNVGDLGGGIFCYRSSPTISNCLIVDNTAPG